MKKLVSMILMAGMLLSSAVSVSAAEFRQEDQINYFQTMNGWEKVKEEGELPAGVQSENTHWKGPGADNVISGTSGGSNALAFDGVGQVLWQFDEVISTGRLHVSFDLKYNSEEPARLVLFAHNNRVNNNPYDYLLASGADYAYSRLLSWNFRNTESDGSTVSPFQGTVSTFSNMDANEIGSSVPLSAIGGSSWHKYDLWLDMTAKDMQVYVDGAPLGTAVSFGSATTGLKTLYFSAESLDGIVPSEIYIDNMYIRHYQDGEYDDIQMEADYDKTGVASDGGIVNLGFSEKLADSTGQILATVFPSDFSAVSVTDGAEYDPTEAGVIDTGVRLTFDDLPAGEYEVVCNSTEIVGAVSGKAMTDTARFIAVGNRVGQETEYRYYLNEDFEAYQGGAPKGWAPLDTRYGSANSTWNSKLVQTEKDGGAALRFARAENAMYKFAQPIVSGKFTIELDVKTDTGQWGVGILRDKDFPEEWDPNYQAYTADGTAIGHQEANTARQMGTLVGSGTPTDTSAVTADVYYKNRVNTWNTVSSGLTLAIGEWNHVKIEIDQDNNTMTLTIGEQAPVTVSGFDADRFDIQRLYQTQLNGNTLETTETLIENEYSYGIRGIVLRNGADANNCCFDNIQVYTEDSCNLEQSFDTFESALTNAAHHAFVYRQDNPVAAASASVTLSATEGRLYDAETNPGDQAMLYQIAKWFDRPLVFPFRTPVQADRGFDVEFDLKAGDDIYSSFALSLLDEEDMWLRDTNTTYYTQNVCLTTRAQRIGNAPDTTDRTFKFAPGTTYTGTSFTAAQNAEGGGTIALRDNEWHHVKFSVIPRDGAVYFKAEITFEDGTTAVTEEYRANNKYLTTDTYGLSFWMMENSTSPEGYESGVLGEIAIDNLKVTETDSVYLPDIADAVIHNMDDTTGTLADASGKTTSIDFHLTVPLQDTDAVTLSYLTGPEVPCTKALSGDGRTLTIGFDTIPALEQPMKLVIGNAAAFGDSYLSRGRTLGAVFTLARAEAELQVKEFRLYELVEGRKLTSDDTIGSEDTWVPVQAADLRNYTADSPLKLVISGYNTGAEPVDLMALTAGYDTGDSILKSISVAAVQAASGQFETEITDLDLDADSVRALMEYYLWEAETQMPLTQELEYETWQAFVSQ